MDATPFPPADEKVTSGRYATELTLLTRALGVCDSIGARLNEMPMAGMSREKFFVLFQFVKALKTSRAAHLLFRNGYDEDAEMLLRVLVEQAIVVRWVRKEDSNARVRAYALYLRQNRLKILETARQFIPDIPLPGSLIKEIEEDGAAYRELGQGEKWLGMTRNIAALAADAGVPECYAVYVNGTNLVHSNPVREHSYVRNVGNSTFFNVAATTPEDAWTPVLAARHLLWIAGALSDVFGFGAEDGLRPVQADVEAYQPDQQD